ncbi:MAG: metalloprotease TldD [Betaproteobacteria bacterium]|nr:metalloprotease TldD [Betaproteobacteria bacterium]MBK8689565.1 metalloprotease TldD [Betaproteobacteria bacterium]
MEPFGDRPRVRDDAFARAFVTSPVFPIAGSFAIDEARRLLLEPAGLGARELDQVLASIHTRSIDFADLYFQYARTEHWSLEEGIVKSGSFSIDRGVGIRAVHDERQAFAYSDDITLPALEAAAAAARAIGRQGQSAVAPLRQIRRAHSLYAPDDPVTSLRDEHKVALLERLERLARDRDSRVVQVMAGLAGEYEVVLVARSDGWLAADVRPLVNVSLTVIVEENGRREQGFAGGGGRFDYAYFTDAVLDDYATRAVAQAVLNLSARDAPAGTMTVVLGNGWPGILLHEAIGHGLEGDFNRKGTSAFTGRVGQRVAAAGITVVDDGTLDRRRGSLNVDDEGNPTQRTVLIEDGILRGYMQDRQNARLMGVEPTGNGRRESFAHLPMPRMTNTLMLPGAHDPQAILASVKDGLYAVNFRGGQVDITSGKFVFSAAEAWRVENGKLAYPVKGATLIGNGPDALTKVTMVGNDLMMDAGMGTCGKDGQSVPVGVGQPTLKIEGLTVGGTT